MEKPGVSLRSEGIRWRAGVLACSTSRARGVRPDESGERIKEACRKWWRADVGAHRAVPDDRRLIARMLNNWCEQGFDVIFTTGGTGFSPTDVTPDAAREVITRDAPGLAECMREAWAKKSDLAWLFRGTAGFRKKTLILNLPGDPAAVGQCLKALRHVLPAALEIAAGGLELSPDSAPRAG
jgi:molybdenum cofactor synthesis domain-containing protein